MRWKYTWIKLQYLVSKNYIYCFTDIYSSSLSKRFSALITMSKLRDQKIVSGESNKNVLGGKMRLCLCVTTEQQKLLVSVFENAKTVYLNWQLRGKMSKIEENDVTGQKREII